MKQYLSIQDIVDLEGLVKLALDFKAHPLSKQNLGKNKNLLLLFSNPSLRTRLSTELAGKNLGMSVTTMNLSSGWNLEYGDGKTMNEDKAEHIREAAQVVSQYADILGFRSFPEFIDRSQDYRDFQINQLAKFANKPVINMESAIRHPLQALTDLITITEHKTNNRPKVVLTWAPHPKALPQAVANSFVEIMKKSEVDLTVTCPEGMNLSPSIVADVPVVHNQKEAFEKADFIYTKNWSSYTDYGKTVFLPEWTITTEKMAVTNNGKFMHCLPVRRNVVVTDKVIDSPNSLVIHQANNRTFAAQAVLSQILENG